MQSFTNVESDTESSDTGKSQNFGQFPNHFPTELYLSCFMKGLTIYPGWPTTYYQTGLELVAILLPLPRARNIGMCLLTWFLPLFSNT